MRILKNNVYMLWLCFKADPLCVCMKIISNILSSGITTLISVYFMRYIVEAVQGNKTFGEAMILIVGMFAVKLIATYVDAYTYMVIEPVGRVKVTALLMEMLYKQAISVDLSCYENPKFYDSYTKANEQIGRYADKVLYWITRVIGIFASIIISIVAIAACEPLVILIAIVPVVCEQLLIKKYTEYKFNRDRDTAYERRQMEYVNRTVYLQNYTKEIRLTSIFTPIIESFEKAVESMVETSKMYGKKIGVVRFFRTILSELIVYLGVQSLIVYQYLVNSAYSFAELTTLLNASSEFSNLIGQFSWARNDIYQCGMFVENFRTFMEYQTKMPENENGKSVDVAKTDICFENVSFAYEGSDKPVLKNINMKINKGERIAIVGHNGAGKSTFVKLLMRLYDTTDGVIKMGDEDIKNYRLSEYRAAFGTIFQDFKIFETSITNNVLLHGNVTPEDVNRAEEALKASGIYDKVKRFPKGMDSLLTKEFADDGVMMSGGEQQKLAIARVFAKNSEICILDEPSSALDPLSEYEIFENMLKACEGKTVIFISHRLSSTVMADRIYMLEEGEIIESGSHEELMQLNGKYAEMYHLQAKKYKEELAYEA
ncbi:MAG: ABC transporter ATP-binding protein [Lachnospiraceae bacterium]|nr:ABC transporter ATP-binding protein [Lachnospiraceae bacterium]